MPEKRDIDLRSAINAISDVVQNRPRPLREFDQIYMKAGDMVLQSELVASWADGKRLAFIGDGDSISVCVAYLQARKILDYGPSAIEVYDFDERICRAISRFAEKESILALSAHLYNVLDPFPGNQGFDCFYTNPPWGESNEGESVKVFLQRGMEAIRYNGQGIVVIADDPERDWAKRVLANVQQFAVNSGFYVGRMMSRLHSYHLDDSPDLRSCNLILKALPGNPVPAESTAITDQERLRNFYGRENWPVVHYVREKKRLDYGKASEEEYYIELWEGPDVTDN